jgi:hypothetical protein
VRHIIVPLVPTTSKSTRPFTAPMMVSAWPSPSGRRIVPAGVPSVRHRSSLRPFQATKYTSPLACVRSSGLEPNVGGSGSCGRRRTVVPSAVPSLENRSISWYQECPMISKRDHPAKTTRPVDVPVNE